EEALHVRARLLLEALPGGLERERDVRPAPALEADDRLEENARVGDRPRGDDLRARVEGDESEPVPRAERVDESARRPLELLELLASHRRRAVERRGDRERRPLLGAAPRAVSALDAEDDRAATPRVEAALELAGEFHESDSPPGE